MYSSASLCVLLVLYFTEPSTTQGVIDAVCEGNTRYLVEDSQGHGGVVNVKRYASNSNCTWKIVGPPDKVVIVRFNKIDLPYFDKSCRNDRIDMFGPNKASLSVVCGQWTPSYGYTSGASTFILNLVSDASVEGGVEFAWYTAKYDDVLCHGAKTLRQPQGTLSSSFNGVESYANDAHCSWLILVEPGKKINLNLTMVEINCDKDSLTLYSGVSPADGVRLLTLGSSQCINKPFSLPSLGNAMFIVFQTDESRTYQGFRATYTSIDPRVGESPLVWTGPPKPVTTATITGAADHSPKTSDVATPPQPVTTSTTAAEGSSPKMFVISPWIAAGVLAGSGIIIATLGVALIWTCCLCKSNNRGRRMRRGRKERPPHHPDDEQPVNNEDGRLNNNLFVADDDSDDLRFNNKDRY